MCAVHHTGTRRRDPNAWIARRKGRVPEEARISGQGIRIMMLEGDIRALIAEEIDVVSGALKEAAKAKAEAEKLNKEAGASSWKGFGGAHLNADRAEIYCNCAAV